MHIYIENAKFEGKIQPSDVYERLKIKACELESGNIYGIQGSIGSGAWALSWLIAGKITSEQGLIKLNDDVIDDRTLRRQSWLVRYDEVKLFGFLSQTVKAQVSSGLSTLSEEKLIEIFKLAPERYNRKLRTLSSEGWRASCAIGFAHGKRIFCFPHISYLHPKLLSEYRHLWLEDILDFLRSSGALVIIPSEFSKDETDIFDEIISLPHN